MYEVERISRNIELYYYGGKFWPDNKNSYTNAIYYDLFDSCRFETYYIIYDN